MKKVSMNDIAEQMGIAKSTVSIALSDKYGVSEEVRSKIILAAIEMGYDFDKVKASRVKKQDKVALIINDDEFLRSPFWVDIIRSIETYLNKNHKVMKVYISKQYDGTDELCVRILDNKISGIIMLSDGNYESIKQLEKIGKPIILVDPREYIGSDCDQIRVNDFESGYYAANYLIDRGHKNLAFLGGKTYSHSFRLRAAGFMAGAEDRGVRCAKYALDPTYNRGYNFNDLEKILTEEKFPIGILTGNDYVASDLYFTAQIRGFKVPDDISIIGFDNIYQQGKEINLTSFVFPKKIIGQKAVECLISRLGGEDKLAEVINISCKLYEGVTVKDLRK